MSAPEDEAAMIADPLQDSDSNHEDGTIQQDSRELLAMEDKEAEDTMIADKEEVSQEQETTVGAPPSLPLDEDGTMSTIEDGMHDLSTGNAADGEKIEEAISPMSTTATQAEQARDGDEALNSSGSTEFSVNDGLAQIAEGLVDSPVARPRPAVVTPTQSSTMEAIPDPPNMPLGRSLTGGSVTVDSATAELASLEECLYGTSMVRSPMSFSREDEDVSENHWIVHDDWDNIREPGSWKKQPHEIQLAQLRKIASQNGIPDEGSHRAVAWRVLIGYLPVNNTEWEAVLTKKRNQYKSFVQALFQDTKDCLNGDELRWKRRLPSRSRPSVLGMEDSVSSMSTHDPWPIEERIQPQIKKTDENALAPEEDESGASRLTSPMKRHLKKAGLDARVLEGIIRNINALKVDKIMEEDNGGEEDDRPPSAATLEFVENARLLDEIRKDVDRTFPDLSFYLDPERRLGKRRYAALERILFVWSTYNKGVKYVQGMNEIVGTIYYVLANDWNEEWACEAEADAYWMFNILVSDMRDVFVPDLDDSDTGIQGRIKMMGTLLRRHDPEIIVHFEEIGVECSFFAIRWWTTLLSREFLLPDTIRLWDSMFASTHKDNFLCYVCVTMVIMIREHLLKADFSFCLRTLQDYPSVMMDHLLAASRALWVYERQITLACHKGGIGLQQALQAVKPPRSIIMAFGFRNGIVPRSAQQDQASEILETAAASVRDAASVVKASAQGWLGRASRLVTKYSEQIKPPWPTERSRSSGSDDGRRILTSLSDDEDSVYIQAIQSADAGKYSYKN